MNLDAVVDWARFAWKERPRTWIDARHRLLATRSALCGQPVAYRLRQDRDGFFQFGTTRGAVIECTFFGRKIPVDTAKVAETEISDEEWAAAETAQERFKALLASKRASR